MFVAIDSSSLPWIHSASNRLGARPPLTSLPWHPAQFSAYSGAAGLPRPPARPPGAAGGAVARPLICGGDPLGAAGDGACAGIVASTVSAVLNSTAAAA